MIPYVRISDLILIPAGLVRGWPLRDVAIHPFGLLVVTAIWLGVALTLVHTRRIGLPTAAVWSFLAWVVAFGFLGGHFFDLLFYAPEIVTQEPGAWLRLEQGQSSLGGFLGASFGSWAWSKRYQCSAWPFAESVASAFPSAWVIGRIGCAVAHDHPGRLSLAWWAVAYPGSPRLDMGLLEAVLTVPLAIALLWLRKRRRCQGFFVGILCIYYAPVRFTLDFSRAVDIAGADARYLHLTPAQWGCILLLTVGVFALAGAPARSPFTRGAAGSRFRFYSQ